MNYNGNYIGFELESEFNDKKILEAIMNPESITTKRSFGQVEVDMHIEFDWELIHELWMRGMRGDSTKVRLKLRITDAQLVDDGYRIQ